MDNEPETIRLTNLFYSFIRRGDRQFSKKEFLEWYNSEKEKDCHYCGIELNTVRELIDQHKIESKRFYKIPFELKDKRNESGKRGKNFEVDRKKPNGAYSKLNCVLVCYFCNNDKSDVFNEEQYFKFIGVMDKNNKKDNYRYKYLHSLLK